MSKTDHEKIDHGLSQTISQKAASVWNMETELAKARERVDELEGIGVICNQRGEEIKALQRECAQRAQLQNATAVELRMTQAQLQTAQSRVAELEALGKEMLPLNVVEECQRRGAQIDELEATIKLLREQFAGMESDRNYYQKRWEEAQTKLGQIRRVF